MLSVPAAVSSTAVRASAVSHGKASHNRMKKMRYVSINGHTIRANAVRKTNNPPIRIARSRSDKNPVYASEIEIVGPARLVYRPNEPILKCGARLVLECKDVVVVK